jgi:hypothetical protein
MRGQTQDSDDDEEEDDDGKEETVKTPKGDEVPLSESEEDMEDEGEEEAAEEAEMERLGLIAIDDAQRAVAERVARVVSGVASTPEPARKDKGEETERAQEA